MTLLNLYRVLRDLIDTDALHGNSAVLLAPDPDTGACRKLTGFTLNQYDPNERPIQTLYSMRETPETCVRPAIVLWGE